MRDKCSSGSAGATTHLLSHLSGAKCPPHEFRHPEKKTKDAHDKWLYTNNKWLLTDIKCMEMLRVIVQTTGGICSDTPGSFVVLHLAWKVTVT